MNIRMFKSLSSENVLTFFDCYFHNAAVGQKFRYSVTSKNIQSFQILRLNNFSEEQLFNDLSRDSLKIRKIDTISQQVEELLRIENPSKVWAESDLAEAVTLRLGANSDRYGCWVYYPWLQSIVHLLDEEEFFRVRTARNMYKITPEEQQILKSKKIGVVGLSVGHAVVMALAMEGIGGELRLADFDTLDLSNCNRIQASLIHLGIPKTEMALRTIAEINPFLKVKIFEDGINHHNIDDFILNEGCLDAIVEECDSIEIKVLMRIKSKQHRVPLFMETSDRGMLDIERYDLDPDLPLLHGYISKEDYHFNMTAEQKRFIFSKIIDLSQASDRAISSLAQLGKTIITWPQLASEVISGGATVATALRFVLLGEKIDSKRIYVDIASSIRGIEQ